MTLPIRNCEGRHTFSYCILGCQGCVYSIFICSNPFMLHEALMMRIQFVESYTGFSLVGIF